MQDEISHMKRECAEYRNQLEEMKGVRDVLQYELKSVRKTLKATARKMIELVKEKNELKLQVYTLIREKDKLLKDADRMQKTINQLYVPVTISGPKGSDSQHSAVARPISE